MKLMNWEELKRKTMFVSDKFEEHHKEQTKIRSCGKIITTNIYQNRITNEIKSEQVNDNFCKSKFCYVCEKIKASKYQIGLEEKVNDAVSNNNYIDFLTLTVPNCDLEDLDITLRKFSKDFKKLRDNLKKNYGVIGFFKSVEITYTNKVPFSSLSEEEKSIYKNEAYFDLMKKELYVEIPKLKDGKKQAHPHYHLLLVYEKEDRFNNPNFEDYKNLWNGLSGGSVFVKKFRTDNVNKSVKELTKYLTKETEYKYFNEKEMDLIYRNLHRKQFYSKGGVLDFKVVAIHESLKDDAEEQRK